MMEDDYYDSYQQKSGPSPARWLFFVLILIMGLIVPVGIAMYVPADQMPLYMVFFIPMIIFGIYATFRWAQGRDIAPTDVSEDERILESMRKHALPAQRVTGTDTFRCGNCNNIFELVNALPVDTDVVHCPFCNSRLHLKE
jgi:DNA-directed RNA polymerase subunit RPC12/RpoP